MTSAFLSQEEVRIKRVMTLPEVAKYSGIPYETLRLARNTGIFDVKPLLPSEKKKRYFVEAVEVWLKKRSGLMLVTENLEQQYLDAL